MHSVFKFVREWFSEWWALMGCASFTFLGIYVARFNKSNGWIIGGSAVLGTIFFFVASYRAWKRQNDAREKAEAQLEAKAELQGTIWVKILQYNPLQDQTKDASALNFTSIVVNNGRKPCQISRSVLILSGPDFDIPRRQEQPLPALNVKTISHGEQYRIDGMQLLVRGIRYSSLRRSTIKIHFMDSLGAEYTGTTTEIEPFLPEAT